MDSYAQQAEREIWDAIASQDSPAPNPVVKRTPSLGYPGWTLRKYADGHWDAHQPNGIGLSPGCASMGEAIRWIASQGERA